MKDKPLISVILPVHNSATTLAESVSSILNQTYKDFEIVAIDDFSKDNSLSVLKGLKKKNKKLRVYKNVKRYGIGITLNRALKKAKGNYITFMDSDDISSPNRLKKQLNFLLNNKEVVAVGSQVTFIDERSKKIGRSDFPTENDLIYQNPLHGISMQFETVLINKTILPKDILRFHTGSNPFVYSDLLMKIAPYGKYANLKEFLHFHRNNPKTYLSDVKRNIISLIKLWIKSKALYDYNVPFRSFFSPIVKSV
ncbi:MAG TPA: glycosyltransferase family 2 protein [Candidatus Sulfotelmatobacter sp.]|nr:glycosyltransferase family 2 protein [Candidatus Sulfotelmatobacter sp.]